MSLTCRVFSAYVYSPDTCCCRISACIYTDKLKDLGNSILGNFGLSLDNFKTVQDPKTGSYNIQFEQK